MTRSLSLASLFLRVALGLYFAIAGWNKIAGAGVGNFVAANVELLPPFMPVGLGKAYLYALPPVEMIAGLMLVVGAFTRTQATLISLMLLSFLIAKFEPMNIAGVGQSKGGMPMDKNLVFLAASITLIALGGGRWAVERLLTVVKKPPQA
jgi:uncharacterized membrane protein YphA (DoxX/SURF4 family)